MKLYTFPGSPNALRVRATAWHLGIDLETVLIDLGKGEQMKPEYLKLNPNHTIPVLEDGDLVLTDSMAIMLYLAEQKPDSGLVPKDVKDRMRMHQWLAWNVTMLGPGCGIYLFENLVKGLLGLGDPDPKELEKGSERFTRFARVLDDHLKGRDCLVGAGTTLADHAVGSWFVHTETAGYSIEPFGEIQRWWTRLSGTDPWKKTLAELG